MKKSGYLLVTSPEKITEADTAQCVHCQKIWTLKKGSGIERGWCMSCHGPTCGGKNCRECVPFMKKIEEAERKNKLFQELGHGNKQR